MTRPLIVLMLTFASVTLGLYPVRAEQQFQSTSRQVGLIELFTSEGCSSCPPAELWLSGLINHPGLWEDFVPVSFHVDYWNRLGWLDTFATQAATNREYDYSRSWGNGSVYTPCFVRNGREWRRNARDLAPAPGASAGVLRLVVGSDGEGRIEYSPVPGSKTRFDAHVALLGCGIRSAISHGENAGRNLQHDFTVLTFNHVAIESKGDGEWIGHFASLRAPEVRVGRLAIAAWVVSDGSLEPLQATGGWLGDALK
jgi:hypothetical protein